MVDESEFHSKDQTKDDKSRIFDQESSKSAQSGLIGSKIEESSKSGTSQSETLANPKDPAFNNYSYENGNLIYNEKKIRPITVIIVIVQSLRTILMKPAIS